jgi:hypothetical protein
MAKASHYDVVSEEYHAAYEPVGIEWARFVRAPHRWLVKSAIALVTALLWKTRSMILIALKKSTH